MPFYVSPSISCSGKIGRNPEAYWDFHWIQIPYPNIPLIEEEKLYEVENTDLVEWPMDEWKVLFGCRECGRVDTYGEDALGWGVLERQQSAQFHNETNCFSVELQCARIDCKAPAKLHVTLRAGETEKDLIRLLRSSFFDGSLPCSHQIMPIPVQFYRDIHRVMSRLW